MDAQVIKPCAPVESVGRALYDYRIFKRRKKKNFDDKTFIKELEKCKK